MSDYNHIAFIAEFENMLSARGTSIVRFDTNAGANSGEYIGKGIQREWVGYLLNHTSSGHTVKAFEPVYSIPLKKEKRGKDFIFRVFGVL